MTKTEDSTHGHLCIEIIQRKLPEIGTKWFICRSAPKQPNPHVGNFNKALCGKVLTASCNRWIDDNDDSEEELETEHQEHQPPVQPTPSPPQPSTATPSPPQSASQSVDNPQFKDEDKDLHEFFRSIVSPEHLKNDDLFCPEIMTRRGCLIAMLMDFGKSPAGDGVAKHFESFCDGSVSNAHAVKDTGELEPCPLSHKKCGTPMSVPAIAEAATAMLNLAEDVPEFLQMPKQSGAKGSGKRIVTIVPSSNETRLCGDSKQWMQSTIDTGATTSESSLTVHDIVETSIQALFSIDSIAFETVAADKPEASHVKLKSDPELQQAMTFAADLSQSQVRTVKTCLCCSNLDILQPETV